MTLVIINVNWALSLHIRLFDWIGSLEIIVEYRYGVRSLSVILNILRNWVGDHS
jgi:hypothetical protein